MNPIDDLTTLEQIDAWVWDQFVRAPHDRQSTFKWPLLSTVGEGGVPQARIVVLLAIDREARHVDIYTDGRSTKVKELSESPQAALTFFDQRHLVQVRTRGRAALIIDGAERDRALAALTVRGRRDYATITAPGSALTEPGVTYEDQLADDHFCIIRLAIDMIDWLSLSRSGHRRAVFDYRQSPIARGWRVP
ncbi:MAG: pyridoxamine 5'-phosphate oxidase family protein [Pseudomonadota bacterium]